MTPRFALIVFSIVFGLAVTFAAITTSRHITASQAATTARAT
ncbi:hypothetical protein [Bradyrhizobium septentrionale]|uniref:Uncharacterized protein n=1 Tax=Bradyrhizobium septentrionale TaxID=1404411 RepID=A0ABZ2NP39_9BRAD|nr:hypothetical protein [Bradyrhizobium septentrionale]